MISLRGWVTPLEKVIKTVKLHSDKSLGAVVNATTLDGMTPLMLASEGAFKDVCIILLSNGANPLAEDKVLFWTLLNSFIKWRLILFQLFNLYVDWLFGSLSLFE